MPPLSGHPLTAGAVVARCALARRAGPPPAAAAEARPAPPGELLVEVAGERGEPAGEDALDGLELTVDGRPVAVDDLGPVAGPWRVVLYFDLLLGDPVRLRAAAAERAARAAELTALGPVEIVLAGETLRTSLPPSTTAPAVAEALSWIGLRETAEAAQRAVRERFVEESELDGPGAPTGDRGTRIAELGRRVRRALADEAALLEAQRRLLLELVAGDGGAGPKLLVLITGGFDQDPLVYYRAALGGTDLAGAVAGAEVPPIEPSLEELGQILSLYGWLVAPHRPAAAIDPLARRTEEEIAAERGEGVETISQPGSLDTPRTVGEISASKLLRRRKSADEEGPGGLSAALVEPEPPLRELARVTGGELLTDAEGLGGFLTRLRGRRRLVFDTGLPGHAPPARIQLRPAAGAGALRVRTRQWVGSATPDALAALRAEWLLDSAADPGELAVEALLTEGDLGETAKLLVRLPPEVALDPESALRVSVGAGLEDGSVEVRHFRIGGPGGQEIETAPDGARRIDLPVFFPLAATVVAVVEELATGRWGGAFAEESLVGIVPTSDDSLFLPAPKAVHLMAPREAMVMGPTTFETVVSQHRVERVEFFLDGERVASTSAPPFSATLDLGRLPESHEIEAVAYGGDGAELGRDRLVVNEGTGSFRIRIVDPRTVAQRRGRQLLVGNVDLRVDVKVPRGADLDRLEVYWRDRLVATRYAPPYVHRLRIDPDDPKGFVRAVAVLEDGALAEDVLFVNSPGSSERVDVDLVELYVVVTDRRGRPVRDLTREQFTVLEEGRPQPLANFGDAGDLPITVGLVIDSSASMFVKLPEVQAAAARYIDGLTTRKDRAFVVGFGTEPRLALDTTSDMGEALQGLYRLEPDGRTAVWKAIVYSLVQLQGVVGKKALIVYSDGADEDPEFSYKTALRFAQRVGVPVYFIIANDEIHRTGGKSLNIRSFLGRLEHLTRQVGGRVFLTPVDADLAGIYEEIDLELRSQYLLGYYPTDPEGEGWREIEVKVDQPGARPRTISGYYR
ncbi:MAG: VWA domain-containing protein [Thermoanaerobaculia bacterium]|nr:VWA domain-containing protein [Thermoanaerobaculia bacterium]